MKRASVSKVTDAFPNPDQSCFKIPQQQLLLSQQVSQHPPRIWMLYGSLREPSYSKLLTLEAAKLLEAMGAEIRVFDPLGLPQPDAAPDTHPKVKELRDLANWSEGMVWCSPERHGAMTGIIKSQIDWIPLSACCTSNTEQGVGFDAGLRRFPILQCSESNADLRTLDAYDHHSKSKLGCQSIP